MDDHNKRDDEFHYYSYGKLPSERENERAVESAEQTGDEQMRVEVAPPREIRSYPPTQPSVPKGQPSWSYTGGEQPRRSTFKSVVASFLAGAIVVGSLMFASDRMNLFSDGEAAASYGATGSASAAATVAGTGGSGAIKTAAIDVVRPNTIPDLVQVSSPAVVKIVTYATQQTRRGYSIFDQFFETPPAQRPESGKENLVQVGSGSGFFFDKEGYILTNEHVINGAEKVEVVVEGTKEPYVAKVLGTAYELDLAVLKIEGKGDFPALPLGDSNQIEVGDWVVAIGNPYEFDHTVTVGVLSAKERAINIPDSEGTREYQALLQTDASINPGNSGGPLLNLNGEVIGINTAVNAQAQGIGFAIPASTIVDVLDALKANQAIPRPYIGVMMGDVPEQYVDDLMLDDADGVFVSEVLLGSPAYKAGLQQYDVIIEVDGQEVKSAEELSNLVKKKEPGDKMTLTVIRNGKPVTVEITVGDRNNESAKQ